MSIKYLTFYFAIFGFFFFPLTFLFGQSTTFSINYDAKSVLRENTIYDIFFDRDQYLWIATNKGFWRFNGINFRQIYFPDGSSLEGTNIQQDTAGNIWVQDFTSGIYKVDHQNWQLHPVNYQKAITGKINEYQLDQDQLLLAGPKRLWQVPIADLSDSLAYTNRVVADMIYGFNEEGLVFYDHFSPKKQILEYYYYDPYLHQHEPIPAWNHGRIFFKLFNFADQLSVSSVQDPNGTLITTAGQSLFKLSDFDLHDHEIHNIKKINGETFICTSGGLIIWSRKEVFLRDHFISDICQDYEGNYWVATTNKGLLKIPNFDHQILATNFSQQPLKVDQLVVWPDLYFTNLTGDVFKWNQDRSQLAIKASKIGTVKNAFYDSVSKRYLFSGSEIKVIDQTDQTIKKQFPGYGILYQDHESTVFRKTDEMLYLGGFENCWGNNHYKSREETLIQRDTFAHFSFRQLDDCRSIKLFPKANNSDHLACGDDYYLLFKDRLQRFSQGKFHQFKEIPVSDGKKLYTHRGELFVHAGAQIIRLTKDLIPLDTIDQQDGIGKFIGRLNFHRGYLIIAESDQVKIYHLRHKEVVRQLSIHTAIASKDFTQAKMNDQYVFVNGSSGLSKIALATPNHQGQPRLSLQQTLLDGFPLNRTELSHSENRLSFIFSPINYHGTGQIHYRLKGLDQDWTSLATQLYQVDYRSIPPGKYILEAFFLNEFGAKSPIVQHSFYIDWPFWRKSWFYLAAGFFSWAIFFSLYRFRLRLVLKRKDMEKELVASKLSALKSQMSPHFMFNALNSIQELVAFRKNDEAYDYILKFSKLVRKNLQYAEKEFIPFETELEILTTYLQMEKMRFSEAFHYSINNQVTTAIKVPPMIIQPFLENAIKHGLLHKKGEKTLQLTLRQQGDLLQCTIQDNGIGRAASQKIKQRRQRFHNAFSTHATAKRLALLQATYLEALGFTYEDLQDDQGQATGTIVHLNLPIKFS